MAEHEHMNGEHTVFHEGLNIRDLLMYRKMFIDFTAKRIPMQYMQIFKLFSMFCIYAIPIFFNSFEKQLIAKLFYMFPYVATAWRNSLLLNYSICSYMFQQLGEIPYCLNYSICSYMFQQLGEIPYC